MRINLKWNEAERVEACRKNDRHVVRCFDCGAGQIRSGAYAEVRRARADAIAESVKDAELVERIEKAKGVATAYEECLGVFDCGAWVRGRMKRFDEKSRTIEVSRDFCGVGIAIFQCIRDEEDTRNRAKEVQHISSAVVEIARATRGE